MSSIFDQFWVGNFEIGVGARATAGERWLLCTWISQLCEAGKAETDKWPLELARNCGRATSDHGGRRGRAYFDGLRQIARFIRKTSENAGHDSRGRNYKAETQLPAFAWAFLPI